MQPLQISQFNMFKTGKPTASNFFTSYTEASSQLSQLRVLKIEISIWLKVRRGKPRGETSELEIRHRKVKWGILEATLDIQYGRWYMVDTIIGDRCGDVIGFVHRVKQTKRQSESVFLHQMRQKNYSNMLCMVAAWSFTCRDKNLQVSKRKHWEHPIRQVDEGKPISCRCSSTYLYKSQINWIHKPSVDLKTQKNRIPEHHHFFILKKILSNNISMSSNSSPFHQFPPSQNPPQAPHENFWPKWHGSFRLALLSS